jgi:uncharacterized protein (TIGR04255 family)
MDNTDLKSKPLVEAILEVRWELQKMSSDILLDPYYKLLPGRLYDRVKDDYPKHQELPASSIPDEITSYTVKEQFRHLQDDWPLIQIGPGILTFNDTHKYSWLDFRDRSIKVVEKLFDSYPEKNKLNITSLHLRYIDAVEFDYINDDVFEFLRDKLKISIELPGDLFTGTSITPKPKKFAWETSFQSTNNPHGDVKIKFLTGLKLKKPALIWETNVYSKEDLPNLPDGFHGWIDAAHAITHNVFFKLIEGDLKRRFSGDVTEQ